MAIRKKMGGGIFNGWLVLIVILGAVIATADGLTRAPNPGLELAPPQPLEYLPYHSAFLLAAVTLPLMFAYAKKVRVSLAEGLFLWFVFCTTAYMKDFSYLRWPGVPLFVTDTVMIALLLKIYIAPSRRLRLPLLPTIFLALFLAAGVIAVARGLLTHRDPVLVLRDSALVAYSSFLLIGFHLFTNWLAMRRAAVWFALGTSLSVLSGLGWIFVAPDQRRFVFPGIYVLVSLVGILALMANSLIRQRVGWPLVGIFSIGLFLANMRSLFVSLVVMFLAALFVPGMFRWRLSPARLVTTLLICTATTCAYVLIFFQSRPARDFTNRVVDNMSSGILHTSDDPYWQFRLTAWKEARRRFQECPSAGEGFGAPFNFEIWDNDPRPHNTFLTVLYKMGLIGFLPLCALLGYFFCLSLQAFRRHATNRHISFLRAMLLAQASFCVFGVANFVLESPYVASLFWAGLGAGLQMLEKFDLEGTLRNLLNRMEHQLPSSKFSTEGATP